MKWELHICKKEFIHFVSVGDLTGRSNNTPTSPFHAAQPHSSNESSRSAPNHCHCFYEILDRPNTRSFNRNGRCTITHLAPSIPYTFPLQASQEHQLGVPSWATYRYTSPAASGVCVYVVVVGTI
jgi:hypothetical protein